MPIYQQLIRIDTVETNGKFETHDRVNEAQIKRLSLIELFKLSNQMSNIIREAIISNPEFQEQDNEL